MGGVKHRCGIYYRRKMSNTRCWDEKPYHTLVISLAARSRNPLCAFHRVYPERYKLARKIHIRIIVASDPALLSLSRFFSASFHPPRTSALLYQSTHPRSFAPQSLTLLTKEYPSATNTPHLLLVHAMPLLPVETTTSFRYLAEGGIPGSIKFTGAFVRTLGLGNRWGDLCGLRVLFKWGLEGWLG
ncbi:hypothetical protein K458DRAFT_167433 [Lentithecium fluviatile CBS 122367]|uniref:Uncharacterized protein n=1 Tax=Lentithecium fluviatile CBS 122367 TaxID=1168545 RepID=A0A6G1JAM9_9PLEO|nr:hypothetical protein K458DRAFT_167433 [Lentithecium fluviatile CBS 122367]